MPEILVGIDGRPGATDGLAFAARLARATGASLRLVVAFPYDDLRTGSSDAPFREQLEQEAEAALASAAASIDGVPVHTEAIADVSPPRALHQAAERSGAALVVVGSTHRGRAGRVLPGSTGERLLHGAPCPVAIVPRGATSERITTIGVGYDASDEAGAALSAACRLAGAFGAALRVIHVFDATQVGRPALMSGPAWATLRDQHEVAQREELDAAVGALVTDVEVEARLVNGRPGAELARESETLDLMVVGSRGYGPLAAVLLGGVGHVLLGHAACPVVVLPRGTGGSLEDLFAPAAGTTA